MDELRKQIVEKIEAKKESLDKLRQKPANLEAQKATYLNAIENHKAKIASLEAAIKKIDVSLELADKDRTGKNEDIEHMEEILERFDAVQSEREELSVWLTARLEEDAEEEWYPGKVSALSKDVEYKEKMRRKLYLDDVIANALPDIRKIFYSRGTVSDYNLKKGSDA